MPGVLSLVLALLVSLSSSAMAAGDCPTIVGDLPPSTLYAAADARLRGARTLVALKERRRLAVYEGGALTACYAVALGVDDSGTYPPGPKRRRGDRKTPEGWYRTSDKPWSSFAYAIAVHYPNAEDARAGLAAGTLTKPQYEEVRAAVSSGRAPPQETAMGGAILLHGGGSSADWTLGCIALDDADLQALRAALPSGMRTDLLILP